MGELQNIYKNFIIKNWNIIKKKNFIIYLIFSNVLLAIKFNWVSIMLRAHPSIINYILYYTLKYYSTNNWEDVYKKSVANHIKQSNI